MYQGNSGGLFGLIVAEGRLELFLLFQLALTVALIILLIRLLSVYRKYQALIKEAYAPEHGDLIEHIFGRLTRLESSVGHLNSQLDDIAAEVLRSFKYLSIIRFDAFHDMGGAQSFSIALCDSRGNGIILTGLHSRDEFRVYAKPVEAWCSPYQLSDEERQALDAARTGRKGD
ncbi:MAG: DUF4446 family protein [Firmicutes bacterium]|nr:DUF4446 family protein [Bacillota bacterium]